MAYVPGCQHDVFVSYARRSDLFEWVSRFKEELERQLAASLGGRPALVWMDSKLQVGDDFAQRIQAKLRHTALFIAVVSPRYVESEACMLMELQLFRSHGQGEIVQVLKTQLEPDQQMPCPQLHWKEFFEKQDWGPDEFEPGEPRFAKAVKQVAVQVRAKLLEMRRSRQKVYLTFLDASSADPSLPTLRRHREELASEFEDRGYATLPRQVIMGDANDDFTRQSVEQSDVLVYLRNGKLEADQYQIAVNLRKPIVTCSLHPVPSADVETDLPVLLGTTDWKTEVVRRVESKLTQAVRA
jgi:hypothetical protein